jgi:hypothetical protein
MEKLAEGLKEVKQWSKVHLEMGNFYNKEVEFLVLIGFGIFYG